jgi:hypothetical protein
MAARAFSTLRLPLLSRPQLRTLATRNIRALSTSPRQLIPVAQQTPQSTIGSSIPTSTPSASSTTSPSFPTEDTTKHAAYLGEADSNDGHEAYRDSHGAPPPSLDATQSAYLGEADSDDGFEVHRDAHGTVESVDASQAAYLGEADSDDGFESDVEIHPEKHRHRIDDASSSGSHGQPGEGDQ